MSNHWKELQSSELQRRFSDKIKPKTNNQKTYFDLINEKIITLCLGPAGSGKSFIPTCIALEWLLEGKINKIVITRPLVTCSSTNKDALGILPGELGEKVGPYLRPLLDVFESKVGKLEVDKLIHEKKIDLIPLDVMRGLSFKNAVIIADEAQNASFSQLHMLLTRFGDSCKLIVNGDPSQSDLPLEIPPLINVYHKLVGHKDIGRVILTREDVVRHPLVGWIDDKLSSGGRTFILDKNCESWYKIPCPYCETYNWADFGDENDDLVPEIDALECWECRNIMVSNEEGDFIKGTKGLTHLTVLGNRRPPIG